MSTIPVTVLGATGVVGQRFVRRLSSHPYFRIEHLCASGRSAGRRYADACTWRLSGEPYAGCADLIVKECDSDSAFSRIVFSALDASAATDIERAFVQSGSLVFSNASSYRMHEQVPLIVPEINADHIGLARVSQAHENGAIVCNPNCTTSVALGAAGPLHRVFGIESISITSMQALSGAGYPGVASLDSLSNVIPFIMGEEEKVETEVLKILGSYDGERIVPARFGISAQCNRVPVLDGHTLCISMKLRGNPSPGEVEHALASFKTLIDEDNLPSAPRQFIRVREEHDRPQPRLDAETDSGMCVHVGRIRACPLFGIKLVVLAHNAERGAAGASVLNAELAVSRGLA